MGTRGTGVLDGQGTRGPGRGLENRSLGHPERPRGAEQRGGGETGHVSPGPARHVSHGPSLPSSALSSGSHRSSWRLGPGLARGPGSAVAAEGGGTQLSLDTSRSRPQRLVGAVVRRRKGREASA